MARAMAIHDGVVPTHRSGSRWRGARSARRSPAGQRSGAVAVLVVVLAVLAPLASVLLRAVWVDGQFSLEALSRILGQSRTWRLVALTVGQAAASTIACTSPFWLTEPVTASSCLMGTSARDESNA